MKRLRLTSPASCTKYMLLFFIFLLSGYQSSAQSQLPVVTVRFSNPQYDCPTQTYCLDVEFLSDTPGIQLFGMNVRFFYDDNILEYVSMGGFQEGYDSPAPPEIQAGPDGSGDLFGIGGPLEWVNGYVQLVSPSTVYFSTTGWTKLFSICFHVDDPNSVGIMNFCPSIIWDLQANPESGGYLPGDDGVVITIVDQTFLQESAPASEHVVQFNWLYSDDGIIFGYPVSAICIRTTCGYVIPLSNWSLFLAIGLMLVASVFIYRRRISG